MGIIYLFNLPTSTERVLNHHTASTLTKHTTNHPAAFPFHKRLFAHWQSEHTRSSYRVKQWWQTSLASLLDTQQASGSAEITSSPLRILPVARRPLPFPGLTKRSRIGAIIDFSLHVKQTSVFTSAINAASWRHMNVHTLLLHINAKRLFRIFCISFFIIISFQTVCAPHSLLFWTLGFYLVFLLFFRYNTDGICKWHRNVNKHY